MTQADEDQIRLIDELVRRVDLLADPEAREITSELTQAILALHGGAIDRMMELISESPQASETIFRRFANDPVVASVLVLHGLHPDDLETRARQVLAKQSTHAEVIGCFEGSVRVRVTPGGCHWTPDSMSELEAALREALPDAAEIILMESIPQNGFVPLASLDPFADLETISTKG